MELRRLGTTGIFISPIALGCWPITGITSVGVTECDSLATVSACLDAGINFLDTAYCYGREGESERYIRTAIGHRREKMVIATKGGIHWGPDGKQARDGRPATLRRQCEESLKRLGTDHVDLLYLHAPDPRVSVAESAGALAELLHEGKTRAVGLSNATLAEIEAFAAECPLSAYQPHYNMLQREIEADLIPWCVARQVSVLVYWPLMKGLLAGKLPRDHIFAALDGRAKYPMFQGQEWEKNQDFIDELRGIAAQAGRSVAQVVINWTIHQPGITAALCGAKRPDQLRENAAAAGWQLSASERQRIDVALARRGTPISRGAV